MNTNRKTEAILMNKQKVFYIWNIDSVIFIVSIQGFIILTEANFLSLILNYRISVIYYIFKLQIQ